MDILFSPIKAHFLLKASPYSVLNNAPSSSMSASLTNTLDSGLTRSSSSSSNNYLLQMQAAERKAAQSEKELHTMRSDMQLLRRELDVYKHSLQESERVGGVWVTTG